MIDVAIVGGGPAGLLAATRLAEAGLDVVVFEEHERVGAPTHCTGIVSLEAAELAKIPDDIVLNRLARARLVGPSGRGTDYLWTAAAAEQILVIDREAFDRGLAEHAMEAGAVVYTGARVEEVAHEGPGIRVETAHEGLRARACVLACGVSYRFQRRLGLGLPARVIHTAQCEVDAEPSDTVEIHFGRAVAPGGFVWTVPVVRQGRPRLKVGAMAHGDAAGALRAFLARPEVGGRLRGEPEPPVRRLLPLRPIPRTYADALMVVGDAGGFTKPTTGGGVFYSLLTAGLAAETLVEGFAAGRLDAGFLARYERRWQSRLGAELSVADRLRALATRCSDREIDLLVGSLGAPGVREVIARTARFNWHRDLILSLVRQPGIAPLLLRAMFR